MLEVVADGSSFARMIPHLKIEMWGTQLRGGAVRCGPPVLRYVGFSDDG